ncbi:MFS transporter [Chitinophaga rhizophila]|uniref:MFS transporter n=1 Tax=Chitinophaga rhizophila TaxID=2866212 RepID=A0ABS7GJK7_9BACT|nr:MFS transporter [Chitinophaga rhizophila]MBW8687895.1 MFS transporter [Chitinophaga rhizophila]
MASLTKTQVFIMATTAGISVANVYYSQPILNAIAHTFQINTEKAGIISVLAQVGYGIGLFFLTPIGDMIERKKLILYLQAGLFLSLLLMAFAPTLPLLYAGSLLIGVFSVVAQVILPMAASLVKENRGKIVAQIFTGILVGILVARVFSGFVTNWLGWQYVYLLSAVMVFFTGVLMQADFPPIHERFNGTYGGLLKSTIDQLRRFPLLRRTALTGMLAFGTLSAFGVTLTFYLSEPPFNYSASLIGMFGLLAAAGAFLAPLFGKLADKGTHGRSLLFSTGLTLISILILKLFPGSVAGIWLTVVLLDVGVQATQVTNISIIYSLDHLANSRINMIYMTSYFIGGALGTYLSILLWNAGGWSWATSFMILLGILSILNVIGTQRMQKQMN